MASISQLFPNTDGGRSGLSQFSAAPETFEFAVASTK